MFCSLNSLTIACEVVRLLNMRACGLFGSLVEVEVLIWEWWECPPKNSGIGNQRHTIQQWKTPSTTLPLQSWMFLAQIFGTYSLKKKQTCKWMQLNHHGERGKTKRTKCSLPGPSWSYLHKLHPFWDQCLPGLPGLPGLAMRWSDCFYSHWLHNLHRISREVLSSAQPWLYNLYLRASTLANCEMFIDVPCSNMANLLMNPVFKLVRP